MAAGRVAAHGITKLIAAASSMQGQPAGRWPSLWPSRTDCSSAELASSRSVHGPMRRVGLKVLPNVAQCLTGCRSHSSKQGPCQLLHAAESLLTALQHSKLPGSAALSAQALQHTAAGCRAGISCALLLFRGSTYKWIKCKPWEEDEVAAAQESVIWFGFLGF
jgi:hypothetical protein